MKFGIFYELSVPRPWDSEAEKTVYDNALEQLELAGSLGFDQVWAVEHHFLEEYSHCSAPEVFLTACAMKTETMRLGHGIVVCVPQFNHPIQVAERAATLDIISGGRLEFGTGRSATFTELGGFRADVDHTKKSWDEFVRVIPKMWTEERFSYDGEFFSMPSRTVLPKPYQKPHPAMWVAVSSPGTEHDAADRGLGCLGVGFTTFAGQEKRVQEYRSRIQNCDPVSDVVNNKLSTINFMYCHEDDATGVKTGKSLFQNFTYMAGQLGMAKEMVPTRSYPTPGLLSATRRQASGPGDGRGAPEGVAIGNSEQVTIQLKKWEETGIDGVNFLLNAAEVIPQEQVLDSIRLFAEEVMPNFAEN